MLRRFASAAALVFQPPRGLPAPAGSSGYTLGPPMLTFKRPATDNAESRIASLWSRWRGKCHSNRLRGSTLADSSFDTDDCRYVLDITISFCIRFTSQPEL